MSFKGRLLTDAIITLLEGEYLLVGDGDKPSGGGWQGTPGQSKYEPYTVVYAVTGGYFDGTIGEPFVDGRPDYIISSFGATQQQAQWGNDTVYAVLTSSKPTVSGAVVQLIVPDVDGGAVRDDDEGIAVYHSPSRWRFFVTSDNA
jgi:hypothetical protein